MLLIKTGFDPLDSTKMRIYYHNDFDGIASSVLLMRFFHYQGINIRDVNPVDYNIISTWEKSKLKTPASVVDFAFHPQAEFWFDHHRLGSHLTDTITSSLKKAHDPSYKSCAALVHDHLRLNYSFHVPRYSQMIAYANLIDSNGYKNPEAVLACKNLWEKIALISQLHKDTNLNNHILLYLAQNPKRLKKYSPKFQVYKQN